MYGSMESELEVQRTIKRVELTAFLCLLKKLWDPSKCMSTTKASLTGYGEEKEKTTNPKAGDADLQIEIWEELHNLAAGCSGGSGACKGTLHKERKERDVAL